MITAAPYVRAVLTVARVDMFFFQAEDGIRDLTVTGVQTCALPIYPGERAQARETVQQRVPPDRGADADGNTDRDGEHDGREGQLEGRGKATEQVEIGRASCRERV